MQHRVGTIMIGMFLLYGSRSYAQIKIDSASVDSVARPKNQRPAARADVPAILPGKGLAQHDFIYTGEWDTRKDSQTISLVRRGKVVWTYSIPNKDHHGVLSEFSDLHLLSNGNILYACKTGAAEITAEKKIVWSYECPAGAECHSAQVLIFAVVSPNESRFAVLFFAGLAAFAGAV